MWDLASVQRFTQLCPHKALPQTLIPPRVRSQYNKAHLRGPPNDLVKPQGPSAVRGSGGGWQWRGGLGGPVVAQQCPQEVDAAAGQGEDGLGVAFALGALAVVEAPRLPASKSPRPGPCMLGQLSVVSSRRRPRRRCPAQRSFAHPNQRPGRRGEPGRQAFRATTGRTVKAIPPVPVGLTDLRPAS